MKGRLFNFLRQSAAAVVFCCVAAGAVAAQGTPSSEVIKPRSTADDLLMFSQVLNQIRVNHPDSIDMHDLFIAAIEGMVGAADPHSFVIPAIRLNAAKQKEFMEGRLLPVPVAFKFLGETPIVAAVASGSRAAVQDILPGDELVAIDSRPVEARSVPELEIVLAGPKKSRVTLTFERRRLDGSLVRLDRIVAREEVEDESAVPVAYLRPDQTGYIRVTTFINENTARQVATALSRLESAGMTRLVLDLRDNGGGRIDQATQVASNFLPDGSVVYTSVGRKPEIASVGKVKRVGSRRETHYPVLVLVNAGTASASELLAGALQDHDRAIIFGQPTFGKALLMQGFPLADGSMMMLVVGQIKTPCGRVVQRQYHAISRRNYFRLAMEDRDTVGRPSCKTDKGRTVYGGGGIVPDIRIRESDGDPLWLSKIRESGMLTEWVGGWVTENRANLVNVEALDSDGLVTAGDLQKFRAFAETRGLPAPPGGDDLLERELLKEVGYSRFGPAGYYRAIATRDETITAAVRALIAKGSP